MEWGYRVSRLGHGGGDPPGGWRCWRLELWTNVQILIGDYRAV